MTHCRQNEIEIDDAKKLVSMGVKVVLEGANMPSTNDAIACFHSNGVVLAAAKACNAGGVAVSGLEMAQNATMSSWASKEVDERLKVGMGDCGDSMAMELKGSSWWQLYSTAELCWTPSQVAAALWSIVPPVRIMPLNRSS